MVQALQTGMFEARELRDQSYRTRGKRVLDGGRGERSWLLSLQVLLNLSHRLEKALQALLDTLGLGNGFLQQVRALGHLLGEALEAVHDGICRVQCKGESASKSFLPDAQRAARITFGSCQILTDDESPSSKPAARQRTQHKWPTWITALPTCKHKPSRCVAVCFLQKWETSSFFPPWFVFTLSPTIPANAGSCFALYLLFPECVRGPGLAPLLPPARTELLSGASPPAPDAQQGLPAAAALTRDKAKSAVGHTQETCTHGELRVPFKPG